MFFTFVLIFVLIFAGRYTAFHESWFSFFYNELIVLSIIVGINILHSIYRLFWDERYASKRYMPIIGLIFMIILLSVIWIYLKPEFDRLEEMERKWRIENACTKNDE
jgi:hypothetical protein